MSLKGFIFVSHCETHCHTHAHVHVQSIIMELDHTCYPSVRCTCTCMSTNVVVGIAEAE